MKKLIMLSIVTYALLGSNNSFCMLARIKPLVGARKAFIQQRIFHKSPLQHFDPLSYILLSDESNDHKQDIINALNQQNKLLQQQIQLAEKQYVLSKKNNALLRGIIEQNNLLFETLPYVASAGSHYCDLENFKKQTEYIELKWLRNKHDIE